MTRTSLSRTLIFVYVVLASVLLLALAAKIASLTPWLPEFAAKLAGGLYDYLKEMAPLLIAVLATVLASAFQRRSKFTASLEQEWRGIVSTKGALYEFCEKAYPTAEDYVATFCRLSETIDTMRIVYRNVGETDGLVGLYPYAPLHDMRRALQTLDPRKNKNVTPEGRKLVRDAILQCFYALRENFLEELDLEEPVHPLLISGGRRLKVPGQAAGAKRLQDRQRDRQDKADASQKASTEEIDTLLADLYAREQTKDQAGP
jgi:hypothetical protein